MSTEQPIPDEAVEHAARGIVDRHALNPMSALHAWETAGENTRDLAREHARETLTTGGALLIAAKLRDLVQKIQDQAAADNDPDDEDYSDDYDCGIDDACRALRACIAELDPSGATQGGGA